MTQDGKLYISLSKRKQLHEDLPKQIGSLNELVIRDVAPKPFEFLLSLLEKNPQVYKLSFANSVVHGALKKLSGNHTITHVSVGWEFLSDLIEIAENTRILSLEIRNGTSIQRSTFKPPSKISESSICHISFEDGTEFMHGKELKNIYLETIGKNKFLNIVSGHSSYKDYSDYILNSLKEKSSGFFSQITSENVVAIDAFTKLQKLGISAEKIIEVFTEDAAEEKSQTEITPILLKILQEHFDEHPSEETIEMVKEVLLYNVVDKDAVTDLIGFFISKNYTDLAMDLLSIKNLEVDWLELYKDIRLLPSERLEDVYLAKDGSLAVTPKTKFPVDETTAQSIITQMLETGNSLEACLEEKNIEVEGSTLLKEEAICEEMLDKLNNYKALARHIMSHLDLPNHPEFFGTNFGGDVLVPRMSVELARIAHDILDQSVLNASYINELKDSLLDSSHYELEQGMKEIFDSILLNQPIKLIAKIDPHLGQSYLGSFSASSETLPEVAEATALAGEAYSYGAETLI